MKKVLIFGYSGFVGPYLANEFNDGTYTIFGSDKIDCSSGKELLSDFFIADITNSDEVERVINATQPNFIINLAAVSSVKQSWNKPELTIAVNVMGSINILQASAKMEEKPKIMFIGSSEEYKAQDKPIGEECSLESNNPYGISKLAQERFAEIYRKEFGLKIYCVRSFNHTGVGQNENFVIPSFCKQVAEIDKNGFPNAIHVGNISVFRDFSDVRDVARAYRMVIESDNDNVIYNVGSGKAYKIEDLLKYIISLSSKDIEIIVDKNKFRPTDTPFICCNNSRIKKELGWEPQYDIKETINELYRFYFINKKTVE